MTTADDIFDQSAGNIERLGLREIPFTESPIDLESETLNHIFTGREKELGQVFNLFQSRERRRILVYGQIGIGKSTFLLEVLSVLRRKRPKMLTAYISLPANLDLATTALIAVAREMSDDNWAQSQLYQMGIPTDKVVKERSAEVGVNAVATSKISEKDLPITKSQYPTVSLETLLERAQNKYPDGVVIAIDDLDKQNPRQVRQLMHDAQGMLKGRAWFMLTGHPQGMAGDLLTSERGLFDLQLPLKELDSQTTYQMLINYLSSARIDNDCTDRHDPRCVLPFTPEAAKRFCAISLGKPRLFNRLGNAVLSTAADLQVDKITSDVLDRGLKAASRTLREQAALNAREEQVRLFLAQRGSLSDEAIAIEDLEQLGFRSFSELMPYLERLEEADLAQRGDRDDATVYESLPLLSGENEDELEDPDDTPDEVVVTGLR
ncbi:ATP-binding protein [Spirulina sp. 06S082]|uniref:ATP-binding protein n=1 Tax=Spirulina sp. 06S082 TaxID=3110248 RepID=UPI002B1F0CE4|nr:ATP-binding protein [Spirulina sp. 06S082]MEA5471999.1 ATP-binding protein [Spirulina sp. 06S082]